LPLLAAFLDVPFECSPYRPASRMFWNELFLDVEAIPELHPARGATNVTSPAFRDLQALRNVDLVDYREAMSQKPRARTLADDFFTSGVLPI
jgi:4-alpha-glucanotransferase